MAKVKPGGEVVPEVVVITAPSLSGGLKHA